jgi:hypothetical protein
MINLTKTLRYSLYALLSCVFIACEQTPRSETFEDGEYKSFSNMLNKCKGMTKVVGISEMDGSMSHCKIAVVVIDSTKTSYTCRIGGKLGLNIGDTVKTTNAR